MSKHCLTHCNWVLGGLGMIFCLTTFAPAQQKQPPAIANPAAPQLAEPALAGVQRGTAQEITLTGANLTHPVRLWTNIPEAKITIPDDKNNGKEPARLRVRLDVPADTRPGIYAMRLATTQGLSNLRLFCVDELPQFSETENNHTKASPQPLSVPCVVAGRADAEQSDFFRVHVQAGQRLSFEVLGHRLGSGVDPQITLYDAQGLRELPGGHNNDAPGLQSDCRLTYTFKQAGDYLVEVRDALYRGGADFWYRLRIGDFPCATSPVPMAVKRGTKTSVRFSGPQVDGVAAADVVVPPDFPEQAVWVAPRRATGVSGWPVALAVSDLDESVEHEPNDEPAKANRVPVPGAVTGGFHAKGDVDCYSVAFKKGRRYAVEAQTHELNSPAEVYLVLKNAAGAEVAKSNPAAAPRFEFTAPADGDYTLVVEHLFYHGGPTENYRVIVTPAQPDFELLVGSDRLDVPQGGTTLVNVMAVRRGYAGPIDVRVVGSPDLSGRVSVTNNQPAFTPMLIAAKPDAPRGPVLVAIEGLAVIDGKVIARKATVHAALKKELGGLAYPPLDLSEQVAATVTPKPPFTLALRVDLPEAYVEGTAPVTVTAQRSAGFVEDIALSAVVTPPAVAATMKNIPKGQNEVKVQLKPQVGAALGTYTFMLGGRAKYQGQEFFVVSPPASLVLALPFELAVAAKTADVTPGSKVKVKVTARRKGGYPGPIAVELRNLPAKVEAAKATIPANKTEVEIELTAAADASPGTKAAVNAHGTATAAGNQQANSPNFTVRVVKK